MKHIQFLGLGDIVTDVFIKLKDATVNCDIDNRNCKLCVDFGAKIPYEEAVEVQAVGNSANASVSAARLGVTSALVVGVGRDMHGDNCLNTLKKENVDTSYISISDKYPTNYHYVLRYEAERTILVKHAPFDYTLPGDEDKVDFLYFSSISDHALPFHDEVVSWLGKHTEAKLAFQPGTFQIKAGRERLKEVYKNTEIFFSNLEEAQTILETDEKDIKKLHDMMRDLGPKYVVITDGPNGLTGSDGEKYYSLPMFPDIKAPVDRTGAGDATCSTITAMMATGIPFTEALRYGPINSMNVVQYIGAQTGLLSKEKIEEYLNTAPENYKVTEI
jgi:ribokinase